tara:strand:+ start:2219 stop:3349 length:1131 start_codon:yes stop_codon:yes gene_type:complete
MSDFTVTVTANEDFPDNTPITRAMLKNAATPQVELTGTIGNADLSNGVITGNKISATANIEHTKLQITQSCMVAGVASGKVIALDPDAASGDIYSSSNTSGTKAYVNGGVDGASGNKRARFAVSRGTNPNEWACLGTTTSVGGDVMIDVTNNALKLTIQNDSIEGSMINSGIGGTAADDFTPTIGVSNDRLVVLDNSIGLAPLATVGSDYYGSVIGFTDNGSPAYIPKGAAGSVLTSNGTSNPTWETFYNDFSMGSAQTGAKTVRLKHGLSSVPTDLKWYLKCISNSNNASTHYYKLGAVVYPSNFVEGEHAINISADDNFISYNQTDRAWMRYRGYSDNDVGNEAVGVATAGATPTNDGGAYIDESKWELHVLAR